VRQRRLLCVAAFILSCLVASAQTKSHRQLRSKGASNRQQIMLEWPIKTPPDLLDLRQEPSSATDRSHEMFFDQGAWHGYALPGASDTGTGFVGPFLSASGPGRWAGGRFATAQLADAVTGKPIRLSACDHGGTFLPGALARQACGTGIVLTETLFYATASTTLVRVTIRAPHTMAVRLSLGGTQSAHALAEGDRLVVDVPGSALQQVSGGVEEYTLTLPQVVHLHPNRAASFYLQQSYLPASNGVQLKSWAGSPQTAWQQAGARWKAYLDRSGNLRPELADRKDIQWINTKAVVTLLGNWRAPLGDLHHDGIFPSYSNPDFNAFWSWDSWKHAAALAQFAPELAKEQVRALFDYQLPNGMIPDKVSRDRKENNLRDTKPPLATWAVAAIYKQIHDQEFVAEMFDKLYRYHQWWYENRDHDHNGLAEYGSTDGTREAAAWESGMDNAVRFDDSTMVRNHEGAWSLNQESVDLNCYLYMEKVELASMAALIGRPAVAQQLQQEASKLRTQIQQVFFDKASGYFFDVRLGSQSPVRVFGPEGWIPLWTGVATEDQARSVAKVLMDPQKFNTVLSFPTLAKDDAHFAPVTGYWRGPVWIDQAVFAVEGLERYGLIQEAETMRQKLLTNASGLAGAEPFRETYNPDTGAGQNSRNFSWSAAEYFLLMRRTNWSTAFTR
jgi:putative isomerase